MLFCSLSLSFRENEQETTFSFIAGAMKSNVTSFFDLT